MSKERRICVVTGSRADYGILKDLMRAIREEPGFRLQVIATGMHLSPEFGYTAATIEADGFRPDARIEMQLSSDTRIGTAKSVGLGIIGMVDAMTNLSPDAVVVLGDRYEIFAAAQAAYMLGLPVLHLMGGDITEGAFDESIRHAITKLASLHFPATEPAARRIRQLGEPPETITVTGHIGLDQIRSLQPIDRATLEQILGFRFRRRNLLVTFHPVTLSAVQTGTQLEALLAALHQLGPDWGLVFTKANADPEGRLVNEALACFVAEHENACLHSSLGSQLFFSVMAQVDVVVGNSSSGLLEAPSLKVPTVNVGDRQQGRLRGSSVIDCAPVAPAIEQAIMRALDIDRTAISNPYGDGTSIPRIIDVLRQADFEGMRNRQKRFTDFGAEP